MRQFFLIIIFALGSFNVLAKSEINLNELLQPHEVKQDIDQWINFINKTHPQLSYTVKDVDRFYLDVENLKDNINEPISVLDFWRKISIFNSTLSDGHTVITLPKPKELANIHIANGGGIFPYSVVFNNDKLVIKSTIDGKATELRGSEIIEINGKKINDFIAPLLKRTHGDSKAFRKALLQRRFSEYVWLYYGNIKSYDIVLLSKFGKQTQKSINASHIQFDLSDNFNDNFKFEMLDPKNALLTIETFYWGAEYKDVIAFLHDAFSKVQNSSVEHLIIDIRENGGGDDVIWIDGILPYLAKETWKTGSKYKVKVIEGRAKEGQTVGDVLEGDMSFREVKGNVPKFNGDVSVLISDFTYSSSILFANVIQDYQMGQLVGEPTGGRSGQTGGIQALNLANSNLRVISPRFYLERPKGGHNYAPVEPDLPINYDKTIPEQLVNKLINQRNLITN
ncbi:hypothetical protein HII17_03670 [Thalassotalea sp. M1531]|uniref:Tail specific protease domain-containing protein n=1 Tax=Thalassotalea algicola TaxID=2716224 RepID=A0A7Y0LA98_9GAMM|nr:S41 family peptidase [Thalassotalea algicola]NMP30652.1 hypothetical protein [Thalassotalea algicola]